MHNVRNWEIHALQTEDHIYGWESQAVELDNVHDVLFGNTVFFRVATVLGPYPYAMGIKDSSNVTVRGTRGYRNINIENTRWGATIKDIVTGHIIPELDIAYLGVKAKGREARQTGISLNGPSSIGLLPGHTTNATIELANNGSSPLTGISVTSATQGFTVQAETPARVAGGSVGTIDVTLTADESTPLGEHEVVITVTYTTNGKTQTLDYFVPVMVGGANLALTSTVKASSTLPPNVATNVIDASTTPNRWVSAAGDPLPTLTFDLGEPADLNRLVLYSGVVGSEALRVDSFEVHGLVAGDWELLGSVVGNNANPVEVELTGADAVEQVRIQFTKPSARDGQARVFEVEIYGLR